MCETEEDERRQQYRRVTTGMCERRSAVRRRSTTGENNDLGGEGVRQVLSQRLFRSLMRVFLERERVRQDASMVLEFSEKLSVRIHRCSHQI